MYGVVGGQVHRGEHLSRARTLHGEHRVRLVLIGDRDAVRRGRPQATNHLGGVGRVRDQEHVVVGVHVGDEVVDHPTARVTAQRVLRLPGTNSAQVVAEAGVEEVHGAGAPYRGLAQVRHVEDADRFAHRRVLLEHSPARVLQGHLPPAERGELRAEGGMAVVQRRAAQFGHGLKLSPRPDGCSAAPTEPTGEQ